MSDWFDPPERRGALHHDTSTRALDAQATILGVCVPLEVPDSEQDLEAVELQMRRASGDAPWSGRIALTYARRIDRFRGIDAETLAELVSIGRMHDARPQLMSMRVFVGPNYSRPRTTKKLLAVARAAVSSWFGAPSAESERAGQIAAYEGHRDDGFVAREAEMYAHLEAHPDDEDAWRVFGDWLHERGDPRGELIVTPEPSARRVGQLLPAIVGELAHQPCFFELRHGHPYAVTVQTKDAPETLRMLASHSSTRFLTSVTTYSTAKAVVEPLLALLEARPVRELHLHGARPFPLARLAPFTRLRVVTTRDGRVTRSTLGQLD
ncbi:MAG: TIGR02996 domain-containing protein [Myxococcales bacterium]|nr:TIGR02996 domain-containing protein [Myxococcales bacterium]